MKLNVYFLSLKKETPKRGYWDQSLVEDILSNFNFLEVDTLPTTDFGIVVIPARHHKGFEQKINKELNKLNSCILFLTGDEENSFFINKIKHKNIKIWVQNPHPNISSEYRKIGCGYPQNIHNVNNLPTKDLDWSFLGQMTHSRRYSCINQLRKLDNGYMLTSDGFTKGLKPDKYYEKLAQSKVAPCPSGPVTPDTFRLFEALELGCVPIADNETPTKDWSGFWNWLFDCEVPFITINDYQDLPGYIDDTVKQYPVINNKVQSWWFRYKSDLKYKIYQDILELTGKNYQDNITVVVPISPIKSHPETHILEETVKSIRHHLPNSEIILSFDGVRDEQDDMRDNYNESIRRILWKSRFWGNVRPFIFDTHKHQSGMMRELIDQIRTDLILYVEQDTPLVTDYSIEWDLVKDVILKGEFNSVRFHHEAFIPKEHESMMLGLSGSFMKTAQWSQRPHVASKAFYRRILEENLSKKANCFLEDILHGKAHQSYILDGVSGWNQWKLAIYHPDGVIKRSYHTDGRAGSKKYDEKQIF